MASYMKSFPVRRRLPVAYSTEIGRIITRCAYLEHCMQELVFVLLHLHPKAGRLAVRRPRQTDYFEMLIDLIKLRNLKSSSNLNKTASAIKKAYQLRDALAHSIWIKHDQTDTPVLQYLSGSYVPIPGAKKVKRRIDPDAMEISLETLRKNRKNIEVISKTIQKIKAEVAIQLKTLPQKSLGL